MGEPRRSQQARRDQSHRALLHSAAELVVEHGVRALTLARVGEQAGYSRGIVTHHFGSKVALLEQLARTTQIGFLPGLSEVPAGLERLLRLIDGYIEQLDQVGVLHHAFLALWADAASHPELTSIFRERDRTFRADLRDDVLAGITAGHIRPETDPEAVAVAVVGQLRGIGLQRLLSPEAVDVEQVRQTVTGYWDRAIRRPSP